MGIYRATWNLLLSICFKICTRINVICDVGFNLKQLADVRVFEILHFIQCESLNSYRPFFRKIVDQIVGLSVDISAVRTLQ